MPARFRAAALSALMGATVLVAAPLAAETVGARPESLSGARGVRLIVAKPLLPPSLDSFEPTFRSLLQERLKTQGVPLKTDDRLLAARQDDGLVELIVELEVGDPTGGDSFYRLHLEAVQLVRLARNPAITSSAVTWRWTRTGKLAIGQPAGAASFLRDLTGFAIQQFVNDYRTANGI